MSSTLDLAIELIRRPSLTPDDAGCQDLIGERLRALGFRIERLRFGEVTNLWARHGTQRPLFVYAGHTDVVPTGPPNAWAHPPFEAVIQDGYLYGRGAADMKGSIAAMVSASERFITKYPHRKGSLGFLITSDEEGPAHDGTLRVVKHLQARNETMDWCLVGEPSSARTVGDVIKNGRRGSLSGYLQVRGTQGHVAYPDHAVNPIHRFAPMLNELTTTVWDEGTESFPPTTLQVSDIHAGTGTDNVIPGVLEVRFNFRYSTAVTQSELQQRMESILERHKLDYHLEWKSAGEPFLTQRGALVDAVLTAIHEITGIEAEVSTTGGTSDGRFIAPTGAQVVELGLVNTTIHKIDERVRTADLDTLSRIFHRVLERLLIA